VTWFLLITFYASMVIAGLLVELLFGVVGLTPTERNARVVEAHVTWNYTTILNIGFLVLAAVLLIRFLRTGGPAMLRAMDEPEPIRGSEPITGAEYRCPMHPEVRSSDPGRCPRCGMELTPATGE
jgi:hypothetical protein